MADVKAEIPRLTLELGYLRLQAGASEDARLFFEAAKALRPADPTPELFLGMTLFAENRFADAEKHYRGALKQHADHPLLSAHLGETLIALRRYGEAEPLLRSVTENKVDAGAAKFATDLLAALKSGIFQRGR